MIVLGLLRLGTSLGRSAPILPRQADLPDEVRSLAGLKKIRVRFEADPDLTRNVRFSEQDRIQRVERKLKSAKLELSDDPDAAEMRVTLMMEGDRDQDLVSITYQISLLQSAVVPRLEKRFHVPTYTLVFGDLASRSRLHEVIDENLWPMVQAFLNRISMANQFRRSGK